MPNKVPDPVAKAELSEVVTQLNAVIQKLKEESGDSRLFKSGVELIKLTATVRGGIEFSVVVAGKDAPRHEVPPAKKPGEETNS